MSWKVMNSRTQQQTQQELGLTKDTITFPATHHISDEEKTMSEYMIVTARTILQIPLNNHHEIMIRTPFLGTPIPPLLNSRSSLHIHLITLEG